MAGSLKDCKFNFDSHITKITHNSGWTTNTSGSTFSGTGLDMSGTYTVELENGYVIDTVTITEGTLDSKTDNSFTISVNGYDATTIVNITSKQQTSSTTHKLTFDSNITITVNGSSVTTSPYNLNNGDVITATTGGGYKISINGTLYGGTSTININNQDINIVRSTSETFDVLLVTINYTETSIPTYSFKHWKKSNVVVNRTLVGEKYYYFKPYTILGLYRIDTTLTNCTGASVNATKIQENGVLTLTFTANSGYELPTGVSVTNVTSYYWNKSMGVLAISKPTGDVAIEIVAVSALPQLSTPSNVAVTDTTLIFDEVANATSYEVFVDNVSIGTHTMPSVISLKWKFNGTKAFIPQMSYDNSFEIDYDVYNNDTLVESNLHYVYFNDNYTYMEFGSSGYWDTTNNKYGGGNIILFKTEPSGFLLQFLQEHCEALN